MVIVQMPLYSIRAWGKFYGSFAGDAPIPPNVHNPRICIYQRRMGVNGKITIKEKYYKPANPQSVDQTIRRNLFADGVSKWQIMDTTEKQIYKVYGKPDRLPGYQKFLSLYLNGKIT